MKEFLRRHWQPVIFGVVAAAYYPRFMHEGGMLLYRHAAECLWNGQVLQACELGFTYPPVFAALMLPFAAMPLWLATVVWYLVTLACTAACLVLCKRIALDQIPGDWRGRTLQTFELLSFVISLKFILAVYEDQAFDILSLTFLLIGIRALTCRRNVMSGAALAVATAIKVTPLIFLPYLVFKRRYLAAASLAVLVVLISFLPDLFFHPAGASHGYFVTWVKEVAAAGLTERTDVTRYAFWDTANPLNLSLRGMVALAVDGTSYQVAFLSIFRSAQLVFIAIVGPLFLLGLRWRLIAVESCLLIIAMLMLSPMSGRSHFVQLMLPYCVLVAACLTDRTTRLIGIATLATSFILCTGIPRGIAPRAVNDFMTMHSDITWGTLVLVVYLAIIMLAPARWGIARRAAAPAGEG